VHFALKKYPYTGFTYAFFYYIAVMGLNNVKVFLRPRIERLAIAYANDNNFSYSDAGERMFEYFFNSQPEMMAELQKRINQNPSLTERRIRHKRDE
jgi:hypothetical protein